MWLLDTANLYAIEDYLNVLNVQGVTTNPTIIRKEGVYDFVQHMKEIRSLIGMERELHVQVVGTQYEAMRADAEKLLELIDQRIIIKVPVNADGIRLISYLKNHNVRTTGTTVYNAHSALVALTSGADYVAPYINRISNCGQDPFAMIANLKEICIQHQVRGKILGASFKNVNQVMDALLKGADCVTVGIDILEQLFDAPYVERDITVFANDWQSQFNKRMI